MNKKGFTLIELLIVVAIIGILSVALVPTGMNALKKSRDAARIANLGTLSSAVQQAVLDDGACPVALNEAGIGSYIQGNVPTDPKDGSSYGYKKEGNYCVITAILEYTEGDKGNFKDTTVLADMTATTCAGLALLNNGTLKPLAPAENNNCFVAVAEL
jgi:prepilin-type N-terminal cleavage/methylation domain-containing protein